MGYKTTVVKENKSQVEDVYFISDEITYEEIDSIEVSGRAFEFYGESKCGKTISALTLGFLSLDYLEELKKYGFKYIPYALENKFIPSIEKIIIIDSEGLRGQLGRPSERIMFQDFIKQKKMRIIQIATPSTKEILVSNRIRVDKESAQRVMLSADIYSAAIEKAVKEDEHTLVIVDSASRLKWLLDSKAEIVYQDKVANNVVSGSEKTKAMEKYGPRNLEWVRLMTLLKQSRATTVFTTMMTNTPQWVIDMVVKKGGHVKSRTKETIEKGKEYNVDETIYFDKDEDNRKYSIVDSQRSFTDGEAERVYMKKNDRFNFLWNIEYLLQGELENEI